jgi:hypothetical protein
MSRPLRIEYAGAVYHITSRGNEKKTVFEDDADGTPEIPGGRANATVIVLPIHAYGDSVPPGEK